MSQEIKKITQEDLRHFTGTEHHHKEIFGLIITDGVKYLTDYIKSKWLLTDIASHYFFNPKIIKNREENNFLIVDLKINQEDKTAVLYLAEDKHEGKYLKLLAKQDIPYTDIINYYKDNEINFYLMGGVLLLPSEY